MSKLIRDFDDESGVIDFPLMGGEIEIMIHDAPLSYAEKCAEYLAQLPGNVIEKLCESSIRYCERRRQYFQEEEFSVPKNISGRDILKHISIQSMIVETPKDETIAFHLEGNCDWEEEHGIEWSIKDGEVLYVGSFNDESPWRGKEYFKRASWNYAVVE